MSPEVFAVGNATLDARAYVLIEAEADQVGAASMALHAIPHVHAADIATGPHDIIGTIATPDQRAIGRLVMDLWHAIAGITCRITCL